MAAASVIAATAVPATYRRHNNNSYQVVIDLMSVQQSTSSTIKISKKRVAFSLMNSSTSESVPYFFSCMRNY